jgi:NodT family efflux transporter outer membrane factor (OMF) lipoprotein
MNITKLFLAVSLGLLCSCATQTRYRIPETDVSSQYPATNTDQDDSRTVMADSQIFPSPVTQNSAWWQNFQDERLNLLMTDVFERNNNLAAASLKVYRAQLQAGIAKQNLWPDLSGSITSNESRVLDDGSKTTSNNASFSLNYLVDLWGRMRLQKNSAEWEAQATSFDRESTALALAGTTANLYFTLAYLNQRISLTRQNLEDTTKTLSLVQIQYKAGSLSSLELNEAQQSLTSEQTNLADLIQQRHKTRNALALLRDGQHWPINNEPQDLEAIQHLQLQAGVPAELLGRRPDLRAAELRLKKSMANIDIVRKSYYPSFNLTSSVGSSSTELENIGLLNLNFLNLRKMKLDRALAKTDYEVAATNFEQTLYSALNEVDDALSLRTAIEQQIESSSMSLNSAKKIEHINALRYTAGAISLRTWLDSKERLRNAELNYSNLRRNLLQNDATFFQAIGGGFQN